MKKIVVLLLAALLVLSGCGAGTEEKTPLQVDLKALYAELEGLGLPAMVELNADMMLSLYGIEQTDVLEAQVFISDDGLRADEVWLLKAVDEAAAEKLAGLVENRIRQKDDESITYSPEQNAVVKKSYTATEGQYVFFICAAEVEAMKAAAQEALGK